MKTIAVIGTFDTKGKEFQYIKDQIEARGMKTLCIHTGVFEPLFTPDVSNAEVAAAVGADIGKLVAQKDRATATDTMSRGLAALLPQLYAPSMRALPIGVPKVIVSTMASGNVSQYVGTSDLVLVPSIVDVEGLNDISCQVFTNAVNMICGMLHFPSVIERDGKPLLAATMFGVTTPCIKAAKEYLESQGYEVLVFHATGAGGQTMEALIDAGFIQGVLDITTTEWCDEVVGGVLNAGPHRLEAAGKAGIPQVVSVGALDMVNFGPRDTVPDKFRDRLLYQHNPTVTLMRTTADELRQIGSILADKLNMAKGKTALMLPLRGVSAIDVEGGPFYDAEADQALFDTLRAQVKDPVERIEVDTDINDPAFAVAAAKKLLDMLG